MKDGNGEHTVSIGSGCCTCASAIGGLSRRGFLGGLGGLALSSSAASGVSWSSLSRESHRMPEVFRRQRLTVKPLLTYETYTRRPKTSWRHWGGIRTNEDVLEEKHRLKQELSDLQSSADFPLELLPLSAVSEVEEVRELENEGRNDVVLIFAAGGWTDLLEAASSIADNVIIFVRYRSGPVYLWYEIIHPRFLRQHTDQLSRGGVDPKDVVVDDPKEVLWRLRALSGLKNTVGSRIVALGGAGGWHAPRAPELARQRWELDIKPVSYEELERIIQEARADEQAVQRARKRAGEYLGEAGVSLETDREFVDACFLLEDVFRSLMARFDARAFTIDECMSTIMPVSGTTACLPLSTLNDAGYIAFCESDFVVVPSGILLSSISGKPPFLHNPTFPHRGMITLAHCTAPRRMDGVSLEAARIVTHYESDFGAAPKVEMRRDQTVTIVNPDFRAERWLGLRARIVDAPYRPICRSQIDVELEADCDQVADEMRGFHWMLVYGDYLDEIGYALKKTSVEWKRLT